MTRGVAWAYGGLLVLPAAALLGLFTHYPAVATLWHSFFSTPRAGRAAVFIGADNYRGMLDDPIFWQALTNNLWYAVGTIPLSIALALLMAVWVDAKLPGRAFLRLAYLTPTVLPMIAVANIWLFFYTPEYGLLEQVTKALGGSSHNWLGSRSTALASFMVVTVDVAYALVSVSYHWNNFLWPLIITNSVESRPLTVGLQVFSATDQGIDWSIITAATLLTTAPLLLAFLVFQRSFVQSFMRAGIR